MTDTRVLIHKLGGKLSLPSLPTVVQDGETGRVVPLGTSVAGWADAVEAVCARPERYLAFARAAKARQETVLNWDAWGRTVRGLIEKVV